MMSSHGRAVSIDNATTGVGPAMRILNHGRPPRNNPHWDTLPTEILQRLANEGIQSPTDW